ncbi:MAG: hypothetical protein Aurels2KO_55180 [Aureliella sp.]
MVTANDVLDYSAADAVAWFQSIASEASLPETFNWLGLAECSVTRSRNEIDDSDSLHWAQIATEIYDRLSVVYPDASFGCSSMFCRVAMIARHGVREGNPILDPAVIFNWFRGQSLSLTGANALLQVLGTEPWGDAVADVLRPLRQLKNHLNVINELALHTGIADDINLYRPLLGRLP